MPHRIGPYEFSLTDARRTVAARVEILDEFAPQHHVHLAGRRGRVEALAADLDAWHAPETEVFAALDRVWPELCGARADLVDAAALVARATGSVTALHRGDGGVPKQAVGSVEVDHTGVVGDRQATRRHHGAPFQALCLWSVEVIAALAADGHPIGPGSAGENVTIAGLDWALVTPGVRLAIGSVIVDVSSYAVPCRQNAQWFSDRRFDRIHHRHGPISRMYATVVEPGTIELGDAAVLERA